MFTMAPAPTAGLPSPEDVQVPRTEVVALIVTASSLSHQLASGLARTREYDLEQGFGNYAGYLIHTSGANISKARNEIITRFLKERPNAEWAWLLDSDMEIAGDTLPRLLCAAAVSGAKVIGGLCAMVGDQGPIPTIFQMGDPTIGEVTRVMLDYPDNTIVQVAATGMACLLVHRTVLEGMVLAAIDNQQWLSERVTDPLIQELYRRDLIDEASPKFAFVKERVRLDNWVSEDVWFSLRVNDMGAPVFVDCSTEVGHVKGGFVWWPSDIRKQRGFPDPKTYAVIPTITAELANDIVGQLQGQGVAKIVLLDNTAAGLDFGEYTPTDTEVNILHMPDAGIHEMWNAGIDWVAEDADQRRNVNILVLNDDLSIGPRFATRMVEALRSDPDLVAVSGNYDNRVSDDLVEVVTDICAGRYDGTGGFAGFAFAVKAEWFQSGYRFPEECKWWYGDNDLVQAAAFGAGKVGIAIDAHVEHLDGGGKTGGDWSQFGDQLARDREAFERRWSAILAGRAAPAQTETVAVVSSIYGGYDQFVSPAPQPEVTDWVMVTDSPEPPPQPWRAIHRERPDVDARYAGKAAKYQPFDLVDTDVAIWIDGRVEPLPGFAAWLLANLGDADMAVYRHWGRSSILDEAKAALEENPAKYAGNPLIEQATYYLTGHSCEDCGGTGATWDAMCEECNARGWVGYEDVNLWQTTFFAVRRNDRTVAMGRRWMEEQDRYPTCLLDQIPLPPVIAECGVKVVDLPGGFWDQHGKLWNLRPHIDGT